MATYRIVLTPTEVKHKLTQENLGNFACLYDALRGSEGGDVCFQEIGWSPHWNGMRLLAESSMGSFLAYFPKRSAPPL